MDSLMVPFIALLLSYYAWAVGPSPTGNTLLPTHPESELRPSPPGIHSLEHLGRFWEELGGVKAIMSNVAGQLDKFNGLYLGKLEHRMSMASTLLASVDANIHGLQERSHVWDTFQLHVAAWNEQIRSLDNKLELLSRGQEKITVLDSKVSQLTALDYKLEKMMGLLDDTFQRVRRLEVPRDPLLDEFAARGVLSTLKVIERKVDRLQAELASVSTTVKPKKRRNETEEATGKLVVRCNAPPAIEDALRDVQAKVDLLYDRLAPDTDGNELIDEPGVTENATTLNAENKASSKIAGPEGKMCSRNSETELTESLVRRLNATSGCQLQEKSDRGSGDDDRDVRTLLASCCQATSNRATNFAENAETLLKRIEGILKETRGQTILDRESLETHFRQQTTRFQDLLDRIQMCLSRAESEHVPPPSATAAIPLPSHRDGSDATSDGGQESSADRRGPKSSFSDEEPPITIAGSSARDDDDDDDGGTIYTRWRLTEAERRANATATPRAKPTTGRSCQALALANVEGSSAVYELGSTRDLNAAGRDFYTRYCNLSVTKGGWTVIQRRGEALGGLENFSRSWNDYKTGFGSLWGDFWFGNEYIHRMTYETDVILRVELEDWDGERAWAEYSTFKVDAESDDYRVWVGGYEGNASDSFGAHNGTPFSTVDRDNDGAPPCCPCAPAYGGGWWFYSCFEANLNGDYYVENEEHESFRGIIWEHWHGDYSLKNTRMMVRPKSLADISFDQAYPDP